MAATAITAPKPGDSGPTEQRAAKDKKRLVALVEAALDDLKRLDEHVDLAQELDEDGVLEGGVTDIPGWIEDSLEDLASALGRLKFLA